MNIQPDIEFQNFLREGRFMLQRSRSSGRHVFYPRAIAPGTGADDLDWVEAQGTGTVYSVTVIRPKAPAEPYNVALIDLDEGPRLMSRVEGLPAEAVSIGMRVKSKVVADADPVHIVFTPLRAE
jgi:uncharacterized OB-fold protein